MSSAIYLDPSHFKRVLEVYQRYPHFTLTMTSHSSKFAREGADAVILADNELSYKALGAITQLRKEVDQRIKNIQLIYGRAGYYAFSSRLYQSNIFYEYDLNTAYLNCLKELGGISQPLYDKIVQFDKQTRLCVVGSLATKKHIVDYNYADVIDKREEKNPEHCALWNTVVITVDKHMREMFYGNQSSLFYWVDALFSSKPIVVDNSKERSGTYQLIKRYVQADDGRFFPLMQGT